jgi:hypothetical protein
MLLINIYGFAADSHRSGDTGAKISVNIDTRSLYSTGIGTRTLPNVKYLILLKINFKSKNSKFQLYVGHG